MARKLQLPKPLEAVTNLSINFPGIWNKIDPKNFKSAEDFSIEVARPESKFLFSALSKWRLTKQIFEFDDELSTILMETDKLDDEIPSEIVDHLVYDCFYVKLPDKFITCKTLKNNQGEFTDMVMDGFFYQVIDKSIIFVILFTTGHSQSMGFDIYDNATLKECIDKHMQVSPDVYKTLNFFIQIVLYLCADNADIEENYVQKQTYKKPKDVSKPKDKFTELRKWDVGYRYGAAVKKVRKQQDQSFSGHEGSHARKRTHVRKGHWHHFWSGSKKDGERILSLKWVSPVVVNAEYENVTTIHRAKLIQ